MSGLAYFFKPKITASESNSSTATAEKRSGRRSKIRKSSESLDKPAINVDPVVHVAPVEPVEPAEPVAPAEPVEPAEPAEPVEPAEPAEPVEPVALVEPVEEVQEQSEPLPNPTPKIKLKFNLRSQSVQDTSDDRFISSVHIESATIEHQENDENEENDENDDDDDENNEENEDEDEDEDEHEDQDEEVEENYDQDDRSSEMEISTQIEQSQPSFLVEEFSPSKRKNSSSRKKAVAQPIGTSISTMKNDETSPLKSTVHESQFSEHKQTKSGRTIKYTPYFRELVQGATISPPSSPGHSASPSKRSSNSSKRKQSSIKADLDAIKNGSLTSTTTNKTKRNSKASGKNKKATSSSTKRTNQNKKNPPKAKTNRVSSLTVVPVEQLESEDEHEENTARSDDDDFRQEENFSDEEQDAEDEEEMEKDGDRSSEAGSDSDEWTSSHGKIENDRTLNLNSTLGSISSEMLDGYSLWAMKYRTRHKAVSLDDKRLCRTWKKMSAHDRQRWCLKAEKENFHFPITAELLKSSESSANLTVKPNKSSTAKRKKTTEDQPILLQKTLNQYSKTQSSLSTIRPPNAFVKQTATIPVTNNSPKNYDLVDIAAGIYLLGESLTKMGEKVRQLGHLNPRGTSAATSIDNLSAILFDGTLCACGLIACLANEITTNNNSNRSDPLTNKLMENIGIILPGLS